jgi:hypothetical protein
VRRADLAVALGLVLVASLLRLSALALPHDSGDQVIWAGVARNIAARGLEGYTVRGLAPRYEPLGQGAVIVRFDAVAPPGPILEGFMQSGERYWDAPLVNQPPGFFLMLLASHALLGGEGFPVVGCDPAARAAYREELVRANQAGYERRRHQIETLPEPERARARADLDAQLFEAQCAFSRTVAKRLVRHPPAGAVRAQLWATLPVFLGELATTLLLYFLTSFLAGRGGLEPGPARVAGALAALAYATDPIALFCAHRLLSNAPVACASLVAIALEALTLARKQDDRLGLSLATGIAAGLAISIKVSAVFLLPAIVLGRLLRGEARDRSLVALVGVALVFAAPWWLLQWRVLGHPFGFAWRNQPDRVLVSPWGALVTNRDASYYLVSLARSPFVVLGVVVSVVALVRALRARMPTPTPALPPSGGGGAVLVGPLFALAVIAAALHFEEKEARHLLLAYPPLVAAASVALVRAGAGRDRALRLALLAFVAVALAWQAASGLALALDVAVVP